MRGRSRWRLWVRLAFVCWAVFSTTWIANTYRTRGVPEASLRDGPSVGVARAAGVLTLQPTSPAPAKQDAALLFLCGSGVAVEAYVPLLRPLAEAGYAVHIVGLPFRLALLEAHKRAALQRARDVQAAHPDVRAWVVAGHSLGGALACRLAAADPAAMSALVLIGTTHPKQDDLSALPLPVTKIYGTADGVAPPDRMFANRGLLPPDTHWITIEGGNHSQFGHYGHQLLDGDATVSREEQQHLTRAALRTALDSATAATTSTDA
ncbi:hypothetical protein ASA1KI_27080 [Opitutales bacterium ASA1]|uniref:alpha/beta fold hydrolase n=1 Tax=Congregicoccus parvus TaxID=3081749 RepID=UPI002B2E0647|nr:hypothetical protein ASA1KI_27080 [Opitutales bacterium ASA1]